MLLLLSVFYLLGFARYGAGKHLGDIANPHIVEAGLRDIFVAEVGYTAGTGILKISFAFTLLRIVIHPIQRRVLQGVIVVVFVYSIFATSYSTIFLCAPVSYAWKQALDPYNLIRAIGQDPDALGLKPLGHCRRMPLPPIYLHAALLIVVDLVLGIIIPIFLLKDLKMDRGLKITSGVMLGLASIALVTTIVRMVYLSGLASADILYDSRQFLVWTHTEICWCMIGISCSLLKPLLVKVGIVATRTTQSRGSRTTGGSGTGKWGFWRSRTTASKKLSTNTDGQEDELGDANYSGNNWKDGSPHDIEIGTIITAGRGDDRGESQEEILSWPAPTRASIERRIGVRQGRVE